MAVDWAAVDAWEENHALDEWWETGMADAALLAGMVSNIRDHGRLTPDQVPRSCLFPFGKANWPWENPEALEIVADEPGWDLALLMANLPAKLPA